MKNRFINIVMTSLLVGSVSLFAVPYDVDISHSSVGFKVKHMMISTVSGNFSGFRGSYDLEKGVLKSLTATIKTETINTGIKKRDEHLRSADFFDVKKFLEMTFTMSAQQGNKVTGDLSIHGITKKVELSLDMGGEITGSSGDKRSGFILTGSVNRKDYGLVWNQVMEMGGIVIGEDVKIIVEVEGVRK